MKHGGKKGEINAFERLCDDLNSNELNLKMIDIAIMQWINQRKDIPEGCKNILVQPESGKGLVRTLFKQIVETIGSVELAFRRGANPD